MHRKVVARVFGGIGNQLFIYAAARRLALVNGAELVLDDVSGFERDYAYQRHYQLDHFHAAGRKATPAERLEPFGRPRRLLMRRWNGLLPFERRSYIQQQELDFDPRLLELKPRGALYLEGYWQSEGYFKDVEPMIRRELAIRPPSDAPNQAMAARIREHAAVAVHVRFFDVPRSSGLNNAPADYYQRAIAEMERSVTDAHYYLFSDQPEAARASIPVPEGRITPVQHNQGDALAFADLWLMTQCRHFIIANSTFSWWGAWLGKHPDKRVIAPGAGTVGGAESWSFNGLLPDRWTKL